MAKDIILRTLRRLDDTIEDILGSACFVALYKYNIEKDRWEKIEIEGALHVVGRKVVDYDQPSHPHANHNNNIISQHEDSPILQLLSSAFQKRTTAANGDAHSVTNSQQHSSLVTPRSLSILSTGFVNGHQAAQPLPSKALSSQRSPYGFVILNRGKKSDYIEDITPTLEIQTIGQFFLYHNKARDIFCIWFYMEEECETVYKIVSGLKVRSLFTRNHH